MKKILAVLIVSCCVVAPVSASSKQKDPSIQAVNQNEISFFDYFINLIK